MTHVCPTGLSHTPTCASIPLAAPVPVAQWLVAFGVGLGRMEVPWWQPHSSAPCTRWQQPSSAGSNHTVRRLHMAPAAPWAPKPAWLLPSPLPPGLCTALEETKLRPNESQPGSSGLCSNLSE